MSAEFDEVMKSACLQSLQKEYRIAREAPVLLKSVILNEEEVSRLKEKVAVLPAEYKIILFCHYCFGFSARDTAEAFELENVTGQLRYIQNMQAFFMGIVDARIDDRSFRDACQAALTEYVGIEDIVVLSAPKYSARFRKKLRKIRAAQKLPDYIVRAAKQVAVFLLVCSIGFTTLLVVNVEAREWFFGWIVETFPEYSIFRADEPEQTYFNPEDLEGVQITYIPEGFNLNKTDSLRRSRHYQYIDDQNKYIDISISAPKRSYIDTEDADVQQMEFKGSTAYYWTKGEKVFFIWQQNAFMCHVIANCSIEETIKIARNIVF